MNGRLFFRADAAPEMGLGHVRRCAVLAQACRGLGADVHLLARWREVAIESAGDWAGVSIHEMPWELTPDEDVQWVVEACRAIVIECGVVDHYRLTGAYQQRLKEAGLEWMQFGNMGHANPLLGRWIHDASAGAEISGYAGRQIGPDTEFLMGPGYALVGEGFRKVRASLTGPKEEEVNSILITFGGGDDRGATLKVLGWLDTIGFAGRKLILVGANNGGLGKIQTMATISGNLELVVGNWNPEGLMSGCQLALCAGGTTLHELACLGIPVVILTIAENQRVSAESWDSAGFGVSLGDLAWVEDVTACRVIETLAGNRKGRYEMSQKAWASQDGLGAQRVAKKLLKRTGLDVV
jgi:spore coat polysaccharide biosynthesis predicted glycosyltransferase SpsG